MEKPIDELNLNLTDSPGDVKKRIYSIIAASSGNLVEWFDFYVYAFFAVYFAPSFFPKSSLTVQLLNTAGIFAAGFFMRPVGGWLFGRMADRHGRKYSMGISVIMMSGGSLAVACLPTYSTIGALAPVLLLVARMFQGLSVGGEYGATATYMSEIALSGRRGFYSSFQYVTLIGGQLLAVSVAVLLQQFLQEDQLKEWAWRIPFVIGGITSVMSYILRRTLIETSTEATRNHYEAGSLKRVFRDHMPRFLMVIGLTAGGSLIFYTFTTYMQKYLVNSAGMSIKTASYVMTFCLFVYMCLQPVFGALSDRIGRRNNMLLFAGLAAITTVPILSTLHFVTNPYLAASIIVIALTIASLYTSVSAIVKAELFPPEIRALSVGFSYAIGNSIFGGSAEYIALGLKSIGLETAFYWYVTFMLILTFLISLRIPKKAPYLLTGL